MKDKQAPGVVASALQVRVDRIAQKARERDVIRQRRITQSHLDFSEPRSSIDR